MPETTSTIPSTNIVSEEPATWRDRLKDRILGTTIVGFIIRLTAIPLLFYFFIFIFGFWRAWVDPVGSANYFEYLRGLFDMVVSIAIIVVIISIGVFIVQIARFVNLLRSEVKPITEDTKQAIKNVRVTSEFVQKNAVAPVIKSQTFLAGLIAFLKELSKISRILQRRNQDKETA